MPILKANQRKLSAAQKAAHLKTLAGWMAAHSDCGRGGPYKAVRIHVYDHWMCPCGATFIDPPKPY